MSTATITTYGTGQRTVSNTSIVSIACKAYPSGTSGASPPSGAVIYILLQCDTADTASPPSGFSSVTTGTANSIRYYLWKKTAGASEPSTYTFSITNNTSGRGGDGSNADAALFAVQPVSGAGAETVGTVNGTATSTTATATALTVASGDRIIGWWAWHNLTVTIGTVTLPSGMSAVSDDGIVALGTKTGVSGSTGSQAATNTGSWDNVAVLISFPGTVPSKWSVGSIRIA